MPTINERCSRVKVRKFENGGVAVMFNWWDGDQVETLEAVYATDVEAAEDISDFVTEQGDWEQ